MFDLVDNEVSTSLIREFHESGKIVATLCHGAAALLNAKLSDGTLLVKGENITGFSNVEEIAVDRQKDMPFHLETYLNNASEGGYKKAEKAWDPLVVVSEKKKLVTGQNPASAEGTGEALLKMIKESS
jgi:putative intracellular protease/amidase